MQRRTPGLRKPKEMGIPVVLDATPGGSSVVPGLPRASKAGKLLDPYSLSLPATAAAAFPGIPAGCLPALVENVWQAAKVVAWAPAHKQLLNGKVTWSWPERTLLPGQAVPLADLTGQRCIAAGEEVIRSVLANERPVRRTFAKSLAAFQLGTVDWRRPEAPLMDYRDSRGLYIDLFKAAVEANPSSMEVLQCLKHLLQEGSDILIAETDGPVALTEFTAATFEAAIEELGRPMGHCYAIGALLRGLPAPPRKQGPTPRVWGPAGGNTTTQDVVALAQKAAQARSADINEKRKATLAAKRAAAAAEAPAVGAAPAAAGPGAKRRRGG